MNLDLSFLPEIEEDVFKGFLWYENKAVGLGDNFLQLFYACASKLYYNALYTKNFIIIFGVVL